MYVFPYVCIFVCRFVCIYVQCVYVCRTWLRACVHPYIYMQIHISLYIMAFPTWQSHHIIIPYSQKSRTRKYNRYYWPTLHRQMPCCILDKLYSHILFTYNLLWVGDSHILVFCSSFVGLTTYFSDSDFFAYMTHLFLSNKDAPVLTYLHPFNVFRMVECSRLWICAPEYCSI